MANLIGNGAPQETWRDKAVLVSAGAAGLGLLLWSFRVGHGQGHWMEALLLSLAAPVGFAVLAFGGLLLFTYILWQ